MKNKRWVVPIPGADRVTVARLLPIVVFTVLAARSAAIFLLPFVVFGFLLLQPVLRAHGIPIRNDSTDSATNGNLWLGIAGLAPILIGLVLGQAAGAVAVLFLGLVLIAVRPAALVFVLLLAAALLGSNLIIFAAPLVVVLARREQGRVLGFRSKLTLATSRWLAPMHRKLQTDAGLQRELGAARALKRAGVTAVLAVVAFLMTRPFVDAAAGESGTPNRDSQGAEPVNATGDSIIDRAVRWVLGDDAPSVLDPSRLITVPDQVDVPTDSSWMWWLVAATVVGLLALATWAWRRRPKPGRPRAVSRSSLQRLEAIGATLGQPRRDSEGAITFANRLDEMTGDNRLSHVGASVSGDTYQSSNVDQTAMHEGLAAIEARLPDSPPRPARHQRLQRGLRAAVTTRGAIAAAVGLAVVAGLGWVGWNHVGSLEDPPSDLAFSSSREEPPGMAQLRAADPTDLVGWESCTSFGSQLWAWESAVASPSEDLGLRASLTAPVSGRLIMNFVAGDESWTGDGRLFNRTLSGFSGTWRQDPSTPGLNTEWTVEDVVRLSEASDVVTTPYADRNGDTFTRFESMPAPLSQAGIGLPFALPGTFNRIWVLDVWEEDGMATRIRTMHDGTDGAWKEWRRVDTINTQLPVVPNCAPDAPFANQDWIGREDFTPSRVVPPQIDFDTAGNPFDTWAWTEGQAISSSVIGDLVGPVTSLGIGDLDSVTVTDYSPSTDARLGLDLQWPSGATITQFDADGFPALSLLSTAEEHTVISWETEELAISGSFITLTSSSFAQIADDALDEFLEPFWTGASLQAGDFDGIPGAEITILTQSNVSTAVLGRDGDGTVVAIAFWDQTYPWRELGVHPEAPPVVIQRERELRACLDGRRQLEPDGRCQVSEFE